MDISEKLHRRIKPIHVTIAILVTVASFIGTGLTLLFGPVISVIAGVGIGIACLLFFMFHKEKNSTVVPPVVSETIPPSIPPPEPVHEIPPDRTDQLTGLANENGLMAWLAEKGGRIAADGKGIVILAADLDEFSQVEHSYGKEIAESVLIEVARRVATCTGVDGIAARTSENEFAAIATVVPNHSEEVAAEQAGKLAELLQRPVELRSGVIRIRGSVGAAAGSVSSGAEVLANAREALVGAKRLGRGHYVVYHPIKAN